jgi:5,6,7,8-tetrahydromethanopterin hydro-lyase
LSDREEKPPHEEPAEPGNGEPPAAEPPSEEEIKDPYERDVIRYFSVGESLVGEGNEVAHIDLIVGSKGGPVGQAFAAALLNQKEGHTNLLAVVAPNLPAKPDTLLANKVTIKGATQAVQMFGPAQAAVARAVVDSVRDGVIPGSEVDDLCVIVSVFIHWEATDDKKIYDWNYQATKESLARAMAELPPVSEVLSQEAEARHPFAAGTEF